MTETERQLIDLMLDGALSNAECVDLCLRLENSPDAVAYLADRIALHSDLQQSLQRRQLQQWATAAAPTFGAPPVASTKYGYASRPAIAAILGLLVGVFSVSLVYGYVAPFFAKTLILLYEGFETGALPDPLGQPSKVERWSGDYTEIVGESSGVASAGGSQMLRFMRPDYRGKPISPPSRTSSVWRLIDLRPYQRHFADGGSVVQLSALLNACVYPDDRSYSAFVAIHALDAAMAANASSIDWRDLNSAALALTRSGMLPLDRDPATWQRVDGEQRLPGNTEFLLIEIGVKQSSETGIAIEFEGHFLDEVRLTLDRRALRP
jgi:hypothetical protein